ncbi:hypothetical protein [Halalkalibacter okhensis]|uniref:Uncharacterized protein n=1 Tax=Halalkalibacter okhensis TaxID=333138 RepID=A0A0B0IGJ1_9BACI|nr:hypothetical protein [Halalkalibacter okhensis]KHF40380.1 hypothetical protein LQ50_10345 [Halalkalibacter okhensis]
MGLRQVRVKTELFHWLNKQTDLNSYQVDLVDGFIFMLKKINQHGMIRMINEKELHPRFWRSHDRTFGYELMSQKTKQKGAHLYQFYVDVAFSEQLVSRAGDRLTITERGQAYLEKDAEEQLDLLFTYIW